MLVEYHPQVVRLSLAVMMLTGCHPTAEWVFTPNSILSHTMCGGQRAYEVRSKTVSLLWSQKYASYNVYVVVRRCSKMVLLRKTMCLITGVFLILRTKCWNW